MNKHTMTDAEVIKAYDKDFLGNEINIGDTVIFEAPKYRDFAIGKVITKAEKSCQIEYTNNWNYSKGRKEVVRQFYSQIIKNPVDLLNRQQAKNKELDEKLIIQKGLIDTQQAEIEKQQYILMGVMHSVDKWLDGDELKQDEVNRAATMREKTLQIVEAKQAEVTELQHKNDELEAEIERLQSEKAKLHKLIPKMIKEAKSEAIKEFAERLKAVSHPYADTQMVFELQIDNLVKEMTEVKNNG